MQPLGNYISLVSGNTPSTSNPSFWGGTTSWISAKDMGNFWIADSEDHLTNDGVSVASKLVPKGSVLILTRGMTLHKRVPICRTAQPATFNQDVKAVLPKANLSGRFLPYLLTGNHDRLHAKVDSAGHGTGRLNTEAILSFPVWIPTLHVQEGIADIGEALDERITLLRETNSTLEAIAQALFKSWFVDFDPVRAKMEGRAPEGIHESTAALFPDALEESELGWVPKGWRQQTFRETIQIIGGGTPKTSNPDFWGGDIPWFSVVDAPGQFDVFVIDTEKHITDAGLHGSSTKLLPVGTTIISARGTVGKLALTGRAMAMNQSCYGLRGKAGDTYFTYFSATRLVEQLQQRAHGSVFDTITQETFSGVHVAYPEPPAIKAFDAAVDALMARIRANLFQVQTLSTLRDALLPRLISGQLRLPEAQAATEAALGSALQA